MAIQFLLVASQSAIAQRLGLSWDEIHGIQHRAVPRGLARRQQEPIRHLGVDEKALRKGHHYLTLVNGLDRGRVLFVAEHRKQTSLDAFWPTLSGLQLAGVEAIAMDMWDPFIASTRQHLPEADQKIVFDKFHIAKLLSEAVDLLLFASRLCGSQQSGNIRETIFVKDYLKGHGQLNWGRRLQNRDE